MFTFRQGILFGLCAAAALGNAIFAGCGDENGSPAGPGVDKLAPAVPDGLEATQDRGDVELLWNANVSDPDLAGYVVLRSAAPRAEFSPLTRTVGTNNWTDRAPERGQTYYYRVCAIDVNGNISPMSEAAQVSLPSAPNQQADLLSD